MVRALPNASWVVITCALLDCGREPALVWVTAPLCIAGWQQTSQNRAMQFTVDRESPVSLSALDKSRQVECNSLLSLPVLCECCTQHNLFLVESTMPMDDRSLPLA